MNPPIRPPATRPRRHRRLPPHLARLQRRLAEAFDELWDNFVDPEEPFYDVDGLRWSRRRRRPASGGAGGHRLQRAAAGRDPLPVPHPGGDQRVRHQRPREPHLVHRRQRPQLPGWRPRGRPRRRRNCWPTCRRCSTSSSATTSGTSGSRRSSAARTATASASCGCSPRPTAARGCGSSSPARWPRRPSGPAIPRPPWASTPSRGDVETVLGYWIDGQLVDARRDPAPQGQRRRQRAPRPAAVLSRCARTSAAPRSCCGT